MLVMVSNIMDGPILSAGLITVKMMKLSLFKKDKILKSDHTTIKQTTQKHN
jgi:hypothetical protein